MANKFAADGALNELLTVVSSRHASALGGTACGSFTTGAIALITSERHRPV